MKRRNFIQALLGTAALAALAPFLPLLAKVEPVKVILPIVPEMPPLDYNRVFRGLQYHIINTGTYQGLERGTYIELRASRIDGEYSFSQEVVT